MPLTKCPRCELNYLMEGEKVCKICRMEMKGEPVRDEVEMCTVCGEHPALPGKDVCLFCLKEMSGTDTEEENEDGVALEDATIDDDPISCMDELIPDGDTDGDETMSLEALGEEEAEEDEDEDDQFEQ